MRGVEERLETNLESETAKALSEFIKALPLSNADNDRLIQMMIDHITEAEKGAFESGFHMGGGVYPVSAGG